MQRRELTQNRGAHGSKSRTSWSGKPEVDDYTSFAAFFMHYLSYLHPFPSPSTVFTPDVSPISPVATQLQPQRSLPLQEPPLVILGGYSYGSLILRHLPPVPSIISPFSAPVPGTAASEILLRAHRLADSSNLTWINSARDHARPRRKRGSLNVAMGGEETSPEKRRSSREIRRQSVDREGGRLSIDLGSRIRSLSHRRSFRKGERPRTPPVSNEIHENGVGSTILMPEVRYLLISPLTPPVSTVVAPGLGPRFWGKEKEGREVVGKHTTLAVLGDQDIFSSAKKSREWAERMGGKPGSRFEYVEVAGAGHFWHEIGVEEKLRNALRGWESGVG